MNSEMNNADPWKYLSDRIAFFKKGQKDKITFLISYIPNGIKEVLKYEKNIELFDLLEKEFTFDYEAGDNEYKNSYFWTGILCRAYSYFMLGEYEKVDEVYNRFDQAFAKTNHEKSSVIKKFVITKVEDGIIMGKYNRGLIAKNELIDHFIKAAKIFEELASKSTASFYLKQKTNIEKEQAINLVNYLKSITP